MATLYVENIPDTLYQSLRDRAKARRRSIAAEVLALLEENVPSTQELKARQDLLRRIIRMREKRTTSKVAFASSEEMLREDRER